MKNLAIITARSGSKGLTNKNIKALYGKPLMAYSIRAAIDSGQFDVVYVSTDSEEYADIAISYGAEVPFLRSREAASDTASSWAVVKEAILKYQAYGYCFDTFMLLQPTSPLRTPRHIKEAYSLYNQLAASAIVSVCKADHPPYFYNILPKDRSLVDFQNEQIKNMRRQDMDDNYYRINGAIYLSEVKHFLETEDIFSSNCFAYIMDKGHSIDIDDDLDFICAEALMDYFCTNKKFEQK